MWALVNNIILMSDVREQQIMTAKMTCKKIHIFVWFSLCSEVHFKTQRNSCLFVECTFRAVWCSLWPWWWVAAGIVTSGLIIACLLLCPNTQSLMETISVGFRFFRELHGASVSLTSTLCGVQKLNIVCKDHYDYESHAGVSKHPVPFLNLMEITPMLLWASDCLESYHPELLSETCNASLHWINPNQYGEWQNFLMQVLELIFSRGCSRWGKIARWWSEWTRILRRKISSSSQVY